MLSGKQYIHFLKQITESPSNLTTKHQRSTELFARCVSLLQAIVFVGSSAFSLQAQIISHDLWYNISNLFCREHESLVTSATVGAEYVQECFRKLYLQSNEQV